MTDVSIVTQESTMIATRPDTKTIFVIVTDRAEFDALPFQEQHGRDGNLLYKVTNANLSYSIVFQHWL